MPQKELVDPISVAYVITLFLQTNESCNGSDWLYLSTQLQKCLLPNALLTKSVGFSCWKTDAVYPSKQQALTRESCMSGMKFKRSKCRECLVCAAISQLPSPSGYLSYIHKIKSLGFFSKTNLRCRQNAAGTKSARQQTISKMTHMTCSSLWPRNGWNLNDQELNYQRHCLF